ncbi:hypothetical protein DB32_004315 [Sandaracinus amylolyticus]|uniref:Glutathione S-transferase n=1 Tax=Sandaracinus amylolyticus TaxID=927083 RepID=A0A0F6YJM0_9BACT|nr:hypothetical protein DB32_004315 [Sandaracinus amylolyticus]
MVASVLPSPWSEAAKGVLRLARVPVLAVRYRSGDAETAAWMGASNVPVVRYDDELPRTGWAEITQLAARLAPDRGIVPSDDAARVRAFGLLHEIAGEDGLGWNARAWMIHAGLESGGARGFPLPVARYLSSRYALTSDAATRAPRRVRAVLSLLDAELARARAAGHAWLLGDAPSALDVYAATSLTPLVLRDDAECPAMVPSLRGAFASLRDALGDAVSPALVAHRERVIERPITL